MVHPTQAITDGIVVRDDYVLKLPTGEAKLVSVIEAFRSLALT